MKIVIRTDSSSAIGSGHLMRNLTLAAELQQAGADITFVSRELPGNLCHEAEKHFMVHRINFSDGDPVIEDFRSTQKIIRAETPVDWLIVDHYGLEQAWESGMRGQVGHIMVIDDLANRPHDCDLLLDQNLHDPNMTGYDHLVPETCQRLLGPVYALLRPEFAQARRSVRERNGAFNRLLVSMGGADPHNVTTMILDAVRLINRPGLMIDVVAGAANPNAASIGKLCAAIPDCDFHHAAKNMAELMASADLCIGAGGSTTWERCCLGLPSLIIASSEYEMEVARTAAEAGIGKFLGRFDEVWPEMIAGELKLALERPDLLRQWSLKGMSLVDGAGAARVSRAIYNFQPAPVIS